MGNGGRDSAVAGRVVVVAHNDADTIIDCLDALMPQAATEGLQVVVVDQDSTDSTADVAIGHPLPGRVMVVADGSLQRALHVGSKDAQLVLVVSADSRPAPGWAAAALAALSTAPVVVGADASCRNLALDLRHTRHVALFDAAEDLAVLCHRAGHAGLGTRVAEGMVVAPARHRPIRVGPLPVMPPPPPGPRYEGPVTVVLCTRDRPDHLARCLASLARLEDDDHQIVVVDNHPTPVLDSARLPPRARLVHEPVLGLDNARNRGLDETDHEIVAYVDDDCEVDPHWLSALRASFADPTVGMVTGRVRPATLNRPTQRYFESQFSFDRGFERRRFTRWDDRPWYPLWTGPMGTGCNMAFRRDVLTDIGGFDELLDVGGSVGGGGDLDVFARVLDSGVTAEYTPDALVWHHHRDSLAGLRTQFRGYGEAGGALLAKAVLDRPGLRLTAVRFYFMMFANRLRMVREIRVGSRLGPLSLLAWLVVGQVTGPFRYLWARLSTRRPARGR